jgi:Fur family transcriptional regulator, ferric uptake regulator
MTFVESTLALHLKQAGYSLTDPRREVFATLQAHGPLTMLQLYTQLNRINRTTVYRVVALFEELNIVQRVAKGWKYSLELTDQFVPHHHHFTCTSCHKSISFDEPKSFDVMLETVANHNGFLPTGHTLEIEGLCSDCRATV